MRATKQTSLETDRGSFNQSVLQTRLAGRRGGGAGYLPLNDHPSTPLTRATVSTNSILGECGKQ